MLVELSIIAGNDYTKKHSRYLREKLGLGARRADIKQVAVWIRKHRVIENHQFVAQELASFTFFLFHLVVHVCAVGLHVVC